MSKLRIGIIGFGSWPKNAYLSALQYDGRAVITSVAAASEKTRRSVHDILGPHIAVFDSYEALLNEGEIDAVMIAVPEKLHQEALTAAIKKGIPVFYEPPIADTREQIAVMIELLLSASQITHANLELGLNPVIAEANNLIAKKTIGFLQNVTLELKANWGREKPGLDLCLINSASCWYVDVINRIIGSIPNRVLLLDGYGIEGRRQTTSTGIFDYNGIWGTLKMNVNSAEKLSISVIISGDEGDIELDLLTGELRYRNLVHTAWIEETHTSLKPYADWPGVRESISTFLDSVVDGKTSPGNAKKVAQLNLIGLAADASKDSGAWAHIKNITD